MKRKFGFMNWNCPDSIRTNRPQKCLYEWCHAGILNRKVDAMYDDIVEFAELGEFEPKLKNLRWYHRCVWPFSVAIKAQ